MTKEQEKLCLGNMRLVFHCAKKFASSSVPWDELCAAGNLGLVQAAVKFSPEVNPNFATYAGRCIDNEMLQLFRRRKKHSKVTESLDRDISNCESLQLYDVLPDDTDMVEAVEQKLLVADMIEKIRKLPKRPRKVWEAYLGLENGIPLTQREIAEQMGCSRSLVCRILKESASKIKPGGGF